MSAHVQFPFPNSPSIVYLVKKQLVVILTLRRLAVTVAVRWISIHPLYVPGLRSCSRLVLVVGLRES